VAGVKLTTARWFTPSGRNIELVALTADQIAALARGDTLVRPVFKTDSGRKVFGGGGIIPDIMAGDSLNAPSLSAVFAAAGSNVRRLRGAVTAEARGLSARGLGDQMFTVTPDMRASLYARLSRSGVNIDPKVWTRASEGIDRMLGGEVVRYAFGSAAEARWLVVKDRVVDEAITKLRSAKTTRDLLSEFFPLN
jgi:carboxyl-terminal processing protease